MHLGQCVTRCVGGMHGYYIAGVKLGLSMQLYSVSETIKTQIRTDIHRPHLLRIKFAPIYLRFNKLSILSHRPPPSSADCGRQSRPCPFCLPDHKRGTQGAFCSAPQPHWSSCTAWQSRLSRAREAEASSPLLRPKSFAVPHYCSPQTYTYLISTDTTQNECRSNSLTVGHLVNLSDAWLASPSSKTWSMEQWQFGKELGNQYIFKLRDNLRYNDINLSRCEGWQDLTLVSWIISVVTLLLDASTRMIQEDHSQLNLAWLTAIHDLW